MKEYKVVHGQNIWDVAVFLYGSIEGVFDLMVSNPTLSLSDTLKAGDTLFYHDGFVVNTSVIEGLRAENIIPANGERQVYFKEQDVLPVILIDVDGGYTSETLSLSGSGQVVIDWGDNSSLDTVSLSADIVRLEHFFNNVSDSHRVKLFGDFQITQLDFSELRGECRFISPVVIDELTINQNTTNTDFLLLANGLVSVDLSGSHVSSLTPLVPHHLMMLDLRGSVFNHDDEFAEYLQMLIDNYQNRRPSTILIHRDLTEREMACVRVILGDDSWNESASWRFITPFKTYER